MKKLFKTSYGIQHQVESFFTGSEVQFASDGLHIYCTHGSTVNKVCVDDGQVKSQVTTNNQDDTVLKFTVTNDDKLIIIAYQSGLISKFNLEEETLEREFKNIHTAPISQLKTNSTNTFLATGSSDGTIKLWNLINHYCSHNLKGINGLISCIEFLDTSTGELLFCAGGDDNIHIFDTNTSKRIAKLSRHSATITGMAFFDECRKFISVSRDKVAVVWDITPDVDKDLSPIPLRTIPLYESVESIVIIEPSIFKKVLSQDIEEGRAIFATVGEEGLIKFWDTKTGSKVLGQNESPLSDDRSPGSQCFQLCRRPGRDQLCAVSFERDIFLYDLPELNLSQQLQGHIDEILSSCWFANNEYLAIACNSQDLKTVQLDTSKCQHLKGHTDIVLSVKAVPSDSYTLISSSKDCTILVWKFNPETMDATIIHRATGHTHAIHALAILNETKVFLSGGEDTTLKRWTFEESKKQAAYARMLPQEDHVHDPKVLIASQTIKAHEARIDDIAISPNDQLVATGSRDKTAKVFSVDGLQILGTLKGHKRGVYSVKFSPTDQVVVTAADVCIRMWNLKDFACIKTFQGHDCAVLNCCFLSSGLQILSVGSDGNMKLWDCKTNECTKTIDAHAGNTWVLSVTADDAMIVSGGQDEKLIVWRDTTKEEQEEKLVDMQTRVVQEQDFMNYINSKKWRKALKMALRMENSNKTLNVVKEIFLEPDGLHQLRKILEGTSPDRIDFVIECCIEWSSSAKNSSIAQRVLNLIIKQYDHEQLLKMPGLTRSLDQLKGLTEKSFNRYERLVQQATFVEFFLNSFRVQ